MRYQVIAKLGQGGMASVSLAFSRSEIGVVKLLVLKEMLPGLKDEPELRTMFLDEGRLAARLNHPNVVQTYEVYTEGAQSVIVMEYLDGQSLAATLQRVGREQMPLDVHLYVLAQVLSGLHYAHELCDFDGTPLGVVHRDISPHNVFVTYDGHVKLVDFGIAKNAGSENRTRTGIFKGKLGYAAPEQIDRRPLDRRADIFAVGVMLWEAVARRRIMSGEFDLSAMSRRINGEEPRVLEVAPEAPAELARICDKALATKREDRYATAEELRADLVAFQESSVRADAARVADLMRRTFASERTKMRETIEARLKESSAPQSTRVLGPAPRSVAPPPPAPEEEESSTGQTRERMALTSDPGPPPGPTDATRSRARRLRGLILAGVGVAGVGAAVLLKITHQPPIRFGPPGDAGPIPGDAAPDASPTTVEVTLSAEPPEAHIFLDDAELAANPFRGVLPRSAQARRLRVVANGFITEERLVVLDHDLQVRAQLRPAPPAPSASAAATTTATATAAARAPAYRPPGRAPSEGAAPPPARPPGPGDGVQGPPSKTPRPIDEKF
ncbi:MAG: serine/threonine-protein kinase [Minicystis sp.]